MPETLSQISERIRSVTSDSYTQRYRVRVIKLFLSEKQPVSYLRDYCDIQKGLSYKGKELTDRGALLINLGNILPGGGFRIEKRKYYSGEYKSKHVVRPGDIIIANTDMTQDRVILGSPLIVPDSDGDMIFTHHLFAFRNLKLPREFLYYYFRTRQFHNVCEMSANGTTVLAISKDDVLDAEVPIPKNGEMELFMTYARPIMALMDGNNKENEILQNLGNNLLLKLMSGEIDISKFEVEHLNNHLSDKMCNRRYKNM